MGKRFWTNNENALLRGYYLELKGKHTGDALDKALAAKIPGRTANGIRQQRSKLGLCTVIKSVKYKHKKRGGRSARKPGEFVAGLQLSFIEKALNQPIAKRDPRLITGHQPVQASPVDIKGEKIGFKLTGVDVSEIEKSGSIQIFIINGEVSMQSRNMNEWRTAKVLSFLVSKII